MRMRQNRDETTGELTFSFDCEIALSNMDFLCLPQYQLSISSTRILRFSHKKCSINNYSVYLLFFVQYYSNPELQLPYKYVLLDKNEDRQ